MNIKKYFKVRKLKNYQKTVCGFENNFFRILKNTEKDYYFYGFFDFTFSEYRQLHKGIKLPISGLSITILCIIFNIFWIPFRFISYLPLLYFQGSKKLFDNDWIENKFFDWINIIIIIILTVILILK